MEGFQKHFGAQNVRMKVTTRLPNMPRTKVGSRRDTGELPEAMFDLDLDPVVCNGIDTSSHCYMLSVTLRVLVALCTYSVH